MSGMGYGSSRDNGHTDSGMGYGGSRDNGHTVHYIKAIAIMVQHSSLQQGGLMQACVGPGLVV